MDTVFHRESGNKVALGLLAVIVLSMIFLSACSSGSPRAGTDKTPMPTPRRSAMTAEESVPASLSNAGEYGENVYDYAKAKDWKSANTKMVALRDAVEQVRSDVKDKTRR